MKDYEEWHWLKKLAVIVALLALSWAVVIGIVFTVARMAGAAPRAQFLCFDDAAYVIDDGVHRALELDGECDG